MSKIRGELRQLSPARRLLGLLPVLVVALAVAAALGGVGVAGATEPEVGSAVAEATADAGSAAADAATDAGSAAEAETTSETTADADDAAVDEAAAEETSETTAATDAAAAENTEPATTTDEPAPAEDPAAPQEADAPEEPAAESSEEAAAAKSNAIAAAPAAGDAPAVTAASVNDSIVFKHIQTPDDSASIGGNGRLDGHGYNVMKYSIVLVNTDGTVSYDLPAGSVVPDTYTFNSTTVDMSTALTQMGLTIPGYTLKSGWAFFWWYGNYSGPMYKVPSVRNFGAVNARFEYSSYLGFTGLYGEGVSGQGSEAGYDAYMDATFAESSTGKDYSSYPNGAGYYAYNPTGTLRIVFVQVSNQAGYTSHFVDAFDPTGAGGNQTEIASTDMEMHQGEWNQGTETYAWAGTLESLPDEPTRPGYTFAGWCTSKDGQGNGTGDVITQPSDDQTHYTQDAYYYAKWIPTTVKLTITKVVDKGDANKEFTFRVSATKDGGAAALAVQDGGNASAENGVVTAKLHDQESASITVPYGATVSIAETDRNGYTTTYKVGDGEAKASEDGTYTVASMTADTTVTVTNTAKPVTLTIQKNLTGNQADTTKSWTVTVNGEPKTIKDTSANGTPDATPGDYQTIANTFHYGDTVTIKESGEPGYTTTYQLNPGAQYDVQNDKAYPDSGVTFKLDGNNVVADSDGNLSATLVFHNDKISTPVTGIKSAGIPVAITAVGIAALAIAGGFAYMRRNAPEQAPSGAHMGDRKRRW